jgi:type II secretory pathway pseudopilin PulG
MKKHSKEAGFSLAALIFFAAAASIVAAAAVPAYQMQAKREREKELMFRGQEYTRAIQKYQRKFGAYPTSIDQLLQANGLRFLRKAYKDPITGKDFRLIRINPDGSLNGSKLFTQNANNRPLFGNTQTFGQPQQQQSAGQTNSQQPSQQQGFQQPISSQPFGQQQGPSTPQQPQQPSPSQQPGQPQAQPGLGSFAPIGNSGTTPFSTGIGGTTPISGAGLVGVASDSDEKSVMVYNQRQKYSEWEFIAITGQAGPQGLPQTGPGAGGAPAGLQQANPFAGSNPSTPSGVGAGPTPFGPAPGQTPFGPGGGTSPFGPGGGASPFGPGAQPNQQPFGPTNPSTPANPFSPSRPGKLQ